MGIVCEKQQGRTVRQSRTRRPDTRLEWSKQRRPDMHLDDYLAMTHRHKN